MKDRECLHCKKFYDCEGKAEGVKHCIDYDERPEITKEEPQEQKRINWYRYWRS